MNLLNISRQNLPSYVNRQLDSLFPVDDSQAGRLIETHIPQALLRTLRCIDEVRMWRPQQFDVLHSSQYCIFLYHLANTIWQREQNRTVCTRLFLLNKALNAIDLFYEIEMPEVFFIGHSVGIVLAKATYGNFLVLYQNSTVGKNHGDAPVLEEGVVMYPNTAIIGRCHIARCSVISQGVGVINRPTQPGQIVFAGSAGHLTFKPMPHPIQEDFFRSFRV